MANDAKKISELGVVTTLSANDRVVILANPASSANARTITAANFANSLITSNIIPTASNTQLGVIKVDGTTITISNGVISGGGVYNQQLNTTNNVTFTSLTTANVSSQNVVVIHTGSNAKAWTFQANGELEAPGNIIPTQNNVYTLGNSSLRWEGLWVGGNSVIFADQNPSYPDQVLTVNNGVFYIATSSDIGVQSNAGLRVGNFLLQNNTLSLTNSSAVFYIGTTGATGNLVFNRPIVVYANNTSSSPSFAVTKEGKVSIAVSNSIPAGDVGAVNIVGSSDGSYQGVTNPGGMLHITGNDGVVTRLTMDSFGINAFPAYVGRMARGTANTPNNAQANDTLLRISAVGWTGGTTFPTFNNPTTIEAQAVENFTNTTVGSQWNFYNASQGNTTKTLVASINTSGLKFQATNSGITFKDGSYQNTAFSNTTAVTKLNVGTGLTQSGNVGIVGVDATGVLSVTGTANQVIVTNVGQNITLSLPQNINANATLTFGNLTVNNFTVTGTTTTAGSVAISNKVFNLANNSTSNAQIDQGGFTLGNTAASYAVSFLYDLSKNAWTTGSANLITKNITANAISASNGNFTAQLHAGEAYSGYDYPNATIQADCNINSYNQVIQQNHNSGTQASTDFVAVNDIGTDSANYVDFGINSSTYANNDYSITGPSDGYLYINGGDLAIGTQTTAKQLKFFAGGTTSANKIGSANASGWYLDTLTVTNQIVGTANNTAYVGSITAANVVSNAQLQANLANYQTLSGLSANIALLTANAAGYLGNSSGTLANITSWISGNAATAYTNAVSNFSGSYQTTAGLAANVATLTANNTNFVGLIAAANVVSNAQLQSNLINYQTLVGLASNVATLTSNSANYIGTIPASNVVTSAQLSGNLVNYVSSTQLSGNLANYQTTAGLSANVGTLTSNSANYIGTIPASNVVTTTQLAGNLAFYVTGASLTNNLANYQTTAGLSANVAKLDANNTLYLGGTAAASYVRASGSYTWTNTHTFSNVITFTSEISVHNLLANGVYGATGQVLVANSADGMYWTDLKTHKAKKVKHKDGTYDPEIDATVLQDSMTFVDGAGIVMVSNTTNQTIQINAQQSIRDAGAVNSLVIDFASDETILIQPTNSSTFTMNNYSVGKVVEVWVKPSTNKAITVNGVTAAQATGACTAPVPVSGQMIKMTFLSTTTANTGVYLDVNR